MILLHCLFALFCMVSLFGIVLYLPRAKCWLYAFGKQVKYLWKVMIPLALPTIISITILKMMGAWNSYMWPRLVANDEAHRLITNGLRNAFNDVSGNTDYPRQMAAVALVSLPLFLVFIFLRKYIMKGVSRRGIKG